MTLTLTAQPQIVAREIGDGLGAHWDWQIDKADVSTLRMAMADGLVGTAQRRDPGGQFVLLAWNVGAQLEAAKPRQAAREERVLRQMLLAPEGYTPRVYKPPRGPVGMPTHAPYMHEPMRW